MKRDNPISDSAISDMLRQVQIPANLRESLLRIPDDPPDESKPTTRKPQVNWLDSRGLRIAALAASVVVMISMAGWSLSVLKDESQGTLARRLPNSAGARPAPAGSSSPAGQAMLARWDDARDQVELELQLRKIRRLEQQVVRLEQASRPTIAKQDADSMIVAMSDLATINFGGSSEWAATRMTRVIDQFPDTRGAQIAQRYLDQLDDSH